MWGFSAGGTLYNEKAIYSNGLQMPFMGFFSEETACSASP